MKRALLCKALRHSGMLRLLKTACRPSVTILNYHRIASSAEDLRRTNFDAETYSCTADDLRAQIKAIRKYADIMSLDTLAKYIRERRRPSRHSVALTFDDGYIDNYTLAFPVLREEDCPAAFFIPTRPIEERTLGWWDQIAYIMRTSERKLFTLEYPETLRIDLINGSVDGESRVLFAAIKRHKRIDYDRLIGELASTAAGAAPSRSEASAELMSWEQIAEMQNEGMTIGAHGHTHFIFAHMSAQDQLKDLTQCHDMLLERLHKDPLYLSYPVGDRNHYNETTQRVARDLGFQLAFNFANDSKPIDTTRAQPLDLDRKTVSWPSIDLVSAQACGLNL